MNYHFEWEEERQRWECVELEGISLDNNAYRREVREELLSRVSIFLSRKQLGFLPLSECPTRTEKDWDGLAIDVNELSPKAQYVIAKPWRAFYEGYQVAKRSVLAYGQSASTPREELRGMMRGLGLEKEGEDVDLIQKSFDVYNTLTGRGETYRIPKGWEWSEIGNKEFLRALGAVCYFFPAADEMERTGDWKEAQLRGIQAKATGLIPFLTSQAGLSLKHQLKEESYLVYDSMGEEEMKEVRERAEATWGKPTSVLWEEKGYVRVSPSQDIFPLLKIDKIEKTVSLHPGIDWEWKELIERIGLGWLESARSARVIWFLPSQISLWDPGYVGLGRAICWALWSMCPGKKFKSLTRSTLKDKIFGREEWTEWDERVTQDTLNLPLAAWELRKYVAKKWG